MTIASEITRLQGAKSTARTSIINKGVNVPVNTSVEDYHTYIDQIETGVPQEDYDLVVSLAEGAAIGYPDRNVGSDVGGFGGDSYMCKIGNYIFMVGGYSHKDKGSSGHTLFAGYVGIYYKTISDNSWSWCKGSIGTLDSINSGSAYVNLTPVYIESTNSINIYAEILGNRGDSKTKYFNRVIGSSSINNSSSMTGEDLNNYKIYSSHINVWEIDARTAYGFGYIIDAPLNN